MLPSGILSCCTGPFWSGSLCLFGFCLPSFRCLISALTQAGGGDLLLRFASSIQSCCGEGGALQADVAMCGEHSPCSGQTCLFHTQRWSSSSFISRKKKKKKDCSVFWRSAHIAYLLFSSPNSLLLTFFCIQDISSTYSTVWRPCTKPGGQESTCFLCIPIAYRRNSWEYKDLER